MEEKKLWIKSDNLAARGSNRKWIVNIFIWTFALSIVIGVGVSLVTNILNVWFALALLSIVIFIGIAFDIIGIAFMTADEAPFHALAAKKLRSARVAILLIRNAEKVSNFCNDVIGDIFGIISGAIIAVIIGQFIFDRAAEVKYASEIIFTGIVASVMVGGKAMGKTIAVKNCNHIVYLASKIMSVFVSDKKLR